MALLLTAACLTFASPALAGPPTERLRDFFTKVNVVLRDPAMEDRPLERVARIRRLVHEVADMRAAAASAFGPAWESRSAAERDEFTAVFGEMIERAYVGRLAGVARGGGGVSPVYLGEVVTNDDATVSSVLRGSGHEVRVDYRMTQQGARWRVRDIVLDGVSTVDNYRAQFRRLMQDGSHATLVAHMRAKLAQESYFFARVEVPGSAAAAPSPPPTARVAAAPRVDDLEARVSPVIEWQAVPPPERPAARAPARPPSTPSSPPASRTALVAMVRTAESPAPPSAAPVARVPAPPISSTTDVAARAVASLSSATIAPPAPPAAPRAPVAVDGPRRGWHDVGLWIAVASVVAGVAIVVLGWRAPRG